MDTENYTPQDSTSNNRFFSSNFNMQDPTFIRLRLDTSELLQKIEIYLSSIRMTVIQDAEGNCQEVAQPIGKPLANPEGISQILNKINLRCNNHTVTGNMKQERYDNFIADTRIELTKAIVGNCYEWGITDANLNSLIDDIMGFITPFMSRVIDNKERDSQMQQFNSREIISQTAQKGGLMGGIREVARL